ncbi:ATP-binding cassette domain-containing protein [candidate division KSB1 bacterium]|nr:ATP-binding cassette domain-containing protein [candidate division KSB1 bacterium]
MIQLNQVSFEYKNDEGNLSELALDGINLEIREGEFIAVMGRNGSGKSTFARCLNALLVPTAGEVIVDHMLTSDRDNLIEIRRKVGMVFQNPDNQIVSTTVEREIAFGLENLGVSTPVMHEVVEGTLRRFRLEEYRKHPPHLLSGGEKQRLALAAVMAMNPKYIVFDEPTAMLDPISQQELLNILYDIKSENLKKKTTDQITIIFITQFPEETLRSDRVLILNKGRIAFDDRPEYVFQNIKEIRNMGLDVPIESEIKKMLVEYKGLSLEEVDELFHGL